MNREAPAAILQQNDVYVITVRDSDCIFLCCVKTIMLLKYYYKNVSSLQLQFSVAR